MSRLDDADYTALTAMRVDAPGRIAKVLADRPRRDRLTAGGALFIVAADHTARGMIGVPGQPRARDVVRRDEVQVEQARATTPRARVEAPKRDDKGPAEQPVAKQIAQNAETIRPDAHARQQDAAPPVPVKAEAERTSPAPVPAPARPAAPEAAALPTAQNSQLAAPQPENKPNTPPRPEANQSDKPSNVPGRRA